MYRFIPFLTVVLATTACAELDPPTLVTRDRVLGAKVTVDADPARAWPMPGEPITVTWLTASPGVTPTFAWILAACPTVSGAGLPTCAGPILATSTSTGAVPSLSFVVPPDLATDAIVVTGAICASGTPVVDETSPIATCDDGSRAEVVAQHVFVARGADTNHHPTLADAPFTLAAADWGPADDGGCDALPVVDAGSGRVLIGVSFEAADREMFATDDAPTLVREELQLAAFATAGEVLQQHTYVDPADERELSPVALEWDPPAVDEVPAEGLRVKFFFVVRDLRGGVDATAREMCVR